MSHDKWDFLILAGRTNQKQRTRQALVDPAKALAANGRPLTIADVAEAAQVSVATAYRYFSNPNDLVLEAATPRVPRSWPICPTTPPMHLGLPQDPVLRHACMRAAAFSLGL